MTGITCSWCNYYFAGAADEPCLFCLGGQHRKMEIEDILKDSLRNRKEMARLGARIAKLNKRSACIRAM